MIQQYFEMLRDFAVLAERLARPLLEAIYPYVVILFAVTVAAAFCFVLLVIFGG